ncbi:MAG: methyl-accepting chemotaxis protein [Bacteroidales bacterium]
MDEKSKYGVEISEKAGEKLQEIVPEIDRTSQLVQEITAASSEMNSGADQVNNAIQQLNNVTQQNAASSEELATSAEELSSQAEQLKQTIAYFTLNGENDKDENFADKQYQNFNQYSNVQNLQKGNGSSLGEKKPSQDIDPKQPPENKVDLKMYNNEKQDDEFEQY